MGLDPFAAASLPSNAHALYVLALQTVPTGVVTLSAVLGAAAPIAPVPLLYDSEPVVIVPGTVVAVSGSFELPYPDDGQAPIPIAAFAVVAGVPPSLLLGTVPLADALTLPGPGAVALANVALMVAKQQG